MEEEEEEEKKGENKGKRKRLEKISKRVRFYALICIICFL